MVTAGFTLPPTPLLEIHDTNVAQKWKKFRLAWDNYSLPTVLNKRNECGQVATLLTIIGEGVRNVHSTFTYWSDEESKKKIEPVLKNSRITVSLGKMSHSSAIALTNVPRRQARATTNTRRH